MLDFDYFIDICQVLLIDLSKNVWLDDVEIKYSDVTGNFV